jgi:pSer/pThr/pTyr-binding forkhead associated (FHA) protein
MDMLLEVVEGPDAGRRIDLSKPAVLGRDSSADVVLADERISRRHARVSPSQDGIEVEDLDSTNGTFVNDNQLHGRTMIRPGDTVIVGVTVLQARSAQQVREQGSAVRTAPPPLATAPRRPTYVDDDARPAARAGQGAGIPELDRLVDSRVKAKATLAPLALFVLTALIVVIYLGAIR